MKIRSDYVTNSSSSSFAILKKDLDDDQIDAIKNHIWLAEKLKLRLYSQAWSIDEDENFIYGDTYMDNFDMEAFLKAIDVNLAKVIWNYTDSDIKDALDEEDYNDDWRDILHRGF